MKKVKYDSEYEVSLSTLKSNFSPSGLLGILIFTLPLVFPFPFSLNCSERLIIRNMKRSMKPLWYLLIWFEVDLLMTSQVSRSMANQCNDNNDKLPPGYWSNNHNQFLSNFVYLSQLRKYLIAVQIISKIHQVSTINLIYCHLFNIN